MTEAATQKTMSRNSKAGPTKSKAKELKRQPVLDAVVLSLKEKRHVNVTLPIANDDDAFLRVVDRLETVEHLVLDGLIRVDSTNTMLATGRLFDAFTHEARKWQLHLLLMPRERARFHTDG